MTATPTAPVTNVYIDALNFYYGAVKGTPHKWVDLEALARLLVPDDRIGRIKYFTARLRPLHPDDSAPQRQHAYLRALGASPLVEVILGHFRIGPKPKALAERYYPPKQLFNPEFLPAGSIATMLQDAAKRRTGSATMAQVVIPEEKGSDVNLGTHLVYDVLKGRCQKALVVTNDSDLTEPIRLAVAEGVTVGIVNPHQRASAAKQLRDAASFEIPLRSTAVERCQLPSVVFTATGTQIRRPTEWKL